VSPFILRLFGTPLLARGEGGEAVTSLGAKPLALLAYLVLERRPHSRETLAGLLWGESPEVEARASLRQALKQLRDVLGETVHAERALVEVSDQLACDVLDFKAAAEHEPLRASGFPVPRFFEGISIRRAPEFEEWVSTTRGELQRLYHQVLGRLAREAMGQCRWRDAVELADRLLASEPVSDEAAQLAVEARYLAGNRSGALAKFGEYRDLLAH
jgi:DNA-binding SARP family transcriptional activator